MYYRNIILLVVMAAFIFAFSPASLPVTITGHLKKNPEDTSFSNQFVYVFVKAGNKVVAKTLTDHKGDFTLIFTPNKEKSFDFYCSGLGIDTFLLSSVKTFESDTPDITFYIPGKYKKTLPGKTACLKCNRTDKVYPIEYGDGLVTTRHILKSGDTIYSPIVNGTYRERCIGGPAKFYCDRDKVKF